MAGGWLCFWQMLSQPHYYIIGGIFLALLVAHFVFSHPLFCNPRHPEPPGSYGWPLIGETLAFIAANKSSKGVYEFVRERHQRFGEVFKTRIFGKTHVFIPGTEVAKVIFRGEFSQFAKSYIKSMHDAVGDQSLLCVKQQSHGNLRQHLSALFSTEALAKSLERMDKLFLLTIRQWEHKETPIRVIDYTLNITFEIICDMLMSVQGDERLHHLRKNVDCVSDAMLSLPIKLPGTRFYRGMKAREKVMQFFDEAITRRRNKEEWHDDFLQSMLRDDECPENERVTDTQLKDNLLTLILAGQTTTAAAMMWAVKYLDENPDVQEKLRLEQLRIMQRKTAGSSLTLEDVKKMTYVSQVVKEVLRLSSIVSWIPRVAIDDCILNGFNVKKGWTVNIDARFMHLDPSLYNQPREFNPARFIENPKPYSFLAFGAGARTCLGMKFAKLMMILFLHHLVTSYRWKVEDHDLSLEPWSHFPRLKSGCPITVNPI